MLNKKINITFMPMFAILILLLSGCHRSMPQSKIIQNTEVISIYVDAGISDTFSVSQANSRKDIKNYFDIYMAKKAQKLGYSYQILESQDNWVPQKGNYLLCIYLGEYQYGAPKGSAFFGNIFKAGIAGGYEIYNGSNGIILHGEFDERRPGWEKTVERIGTDIAVEFRNYIRKNKTS